MLKGTAIKKQVTINFFDFFSDSITEKSITDLKTWVESFGQKFEEHFEIDGNQLNVITLEGHSYKITPEDIILRGVQKEYYPCKKHIFIETYDAWCNDKKVNI